MKKLIYTALLGALMLSACSVSGSSEESSKNPSSTTTSSQEVSSSQEQSSGPQNVRLTRDEAITKAKQMLVALDDAGYVEPLNYERFYFSLDKSQGIKDGRVYNVDLAKEKMNVGYYHNSPAFEGAKPFRADFLYKKANATNVYVNASNDTEKSSSEGLWSKEIEAENIYAAIEASSFNNLVVKDQNRIYAKEHLQTLIDADFKNSTVSNEKYMIYADGTVEMTYLLTKTVGTNVVKSGQSFSIKDNYILSGLTIYNETDSNGTVLQDVKVNNQYKIGGVDVYVPGK